jgi:hypothetical protein
LFLPNAQCKHVFFGPCHDNGYLVVLERYKRDYASRITLIETRPAETGFLDLGFKRMAVPTIFRPDNLPGKPLNMVPASPVAFNAPMAPPVRTVSGPQMTANSAPFIPKSTSPAPSSDSASSGTWATVGKGLSTGKTINIASKKAPPRRFVLLNVYDERLDAELPRSDPSAFKRLTERLENEGKLCNNYHLRGSCKSSFCSSFEPHADLRSIATGDAGDYCDYTHGDRLSPGEQLSLKHKARSRSCPYRDQCREIDCTYGHHCKFMETCTLPKCYFAHTHSMETVSSRCFSRTTSNTS